MENAWLGRKLLLASQQEPLITLIDHANVTAVDKQADGITLSFNYYDSDEHEQQLQASVLVACDGRDSTVRQLLAIGTTTYDYGKTAIVGVVETDKPHEHVAIERFSPAGPLAVLPLTDPEGDGNDDYQQGYRRSVVWVCPTGEETQYLEDDAHFLATLQEAFGQRAGTFVAAGRRGAAAGASHVLCRTGRCIAAAPGAGLVAGAPEAVPARRVRRADPVGAAPVACR